MIVGMGAAELNLVMADFVDLLNSPEATDCILTWETGTVPDPVYPGKWIGSPTVHSQAFRAVIVFALGIGRMKPKPELDKRRFAEMPDADIALMAPASINLKGLVNVQFEVTGLGTFHPLEQPASDLAHQALMFPSGQAMIQWIFCKAVK